MSDRILSNERSYRSPDGTSNRMPDRTSERQIECQKGCPFLEGENDAECHLVGTRRKKLFKNVAPSGKTSQPALQNHVDHVVLILVPNLLVPHFLLSVLGIGWSQACPSTVEETMAPSHGDLRKKTMEIPGGKSIPKGGFRENQGGMDQFMDRDFEETDCWICWF